MIKLTNLNLMLGVLLLTQACFSADPVTANNDDIPNYSLMWEYPKMAIDPRNNKEYVYEKKENFEARLDTARAWTQIVYKIISRETKLADLKEAAVTDVDFYCPNFDNMTRRQKIVFWGQMVAAISYKESGWSPTSRMAEPLADFPKPDSVTGRRVYSEGLLQLSYQDVDSYKNHFDCGFNWEIDKNLKPDDPAKSILSVTKNLRCGLLILDRKVSVNDRITTPGQYWSVIRPRAINKYSKTLWISNQTKKLPFCNINRK